jgi:hypothetical protein
MEYRVKCFSLYSIIPPVMHTDIYVVCEDQMSSLMIALVRRNMQERLTKHHNKVITTHILYSYKLHVSAKQVTKIGLHKQNDKR